MTIKVYSSSDSGAPVLTGLAGSLIAVLDACLVDGYGSQTSAGWSKAFSGTNKAVYRMPTGVTMRGYFRIVDGTTSATINGYETMSDVDTGPYPFPASLTGAYITKSTVASAASVAWRLITDGRTVYFFAYINGSSSNGVAWGEHLSFKTPDVSPLFVQGRGNVDGINTGVYANLALGRSGVGVRGSNQGCGLSRAFSGEEGSGIVFQPTSTAGAREANYRVISGFATQEPYPNPVTNGFTAVSVYLLEQSGASTHLMRGVMPGLYAAVEHTGPMVDGATITGVTGLPGRTLLPVKVASEAVNPFCLLFDVTGPWQV